MVKFAFLLASTALVAMPAAAQPTEPPGEIVTGAQAAAQVDHLHDEESSAIVVTGHAPGDLDILAGKSVLSGADLVRNLKPQIRSEEHTSELQSLMRISYAGFCLKKNSTKTDTMLTLEQYAQHNA